MRRTIVPSIALVIVLMGACAEGTKDSVGSPTNGTDTSSCEVESLPLHEPGKLTIATGDPVFEPWMVNDDPSNGQGFESAVAYALAAEMGFDPDHIVWVRTGFDEAIAPGEKPYDFNMQQYTITAERAEVVEFSVGYYTVQKALVALPGAVPEGAQRLDALSGLKFGAAIGTTDLEYTEDVIGASDVAVYNNFADAVAAMNARQIDALVVNLPTAYYLTAVEIPKAEIAGILPQGSEGPDELGLLFAKGDPLVTCVDKALEVLRENGTLDDLGNRWLEQGGDIPEFQA